MINLEFYQSTALGNTTVFAAAPRQFANRADLLNRDRHLLSSRSLRLVFAFNIAII